MTGGGTWEEIARRAVEVEAAGFSGLLFIDAGTTPWMGLATAARATTTLQLSTGIAAAFPMSPMMCAALAWELAGNSRGRFRLGLGSQVKAHIERRYAAPFDPPGPRLRDYVEAVRACFRAFAGTEKLDHRGPYYPLTLLTPMFTPARIDVPAPAIDISAVGPWMTRMAGEVADGVHVHPFHSLTYLEQVLLPRVAEGARAAGRVPSEVSLTIPAFTIVGDTDAEREPLRAYVRQQIAFYGSTRNYAIQFDLVGRPGVSAALNERLKAGDTAGMAALIDDELLGHFAVTSTWADLADALVERYRGVASRVVLYCYEPSLRVDRAAGAKWGAVARRVRAAA